MNSRSIDQLEEQIAHLSNRLEEAESALYAIRSGEIDAVLVEAEREQVYTLETPDRPYRLVVEELPYAAATLTADGNVIYCNRAFAHLSGLTPPGLIGRPFRDHLAPRSHPLFERMLLEGPLTDVEGELVLERPEGELVAGYFQMRCLREGAFGFCLILIDITRERHYEELRRTQEALRGVVDRLNEADRRKDEFLATLSHELRNPLAPIRNAVQILKLAGLPNADLEWSRDVIERQVDALAGILEDLFDISRISRGRLDLRQERILLLDVIESALETSRPVIEAAGHELTVSLPREPIQLEGDPIRLSQVFSNLLNNAAKYTDDHGRIALTAVLEDDHVRISVKDSGIGIAPDMLPRIFEIFSQSPRSLDRAQGGLGIGLSLVRGIVSLHHGSIEARSDGSDKGSEFIVCLPIAAKAAIERSGAVEANVEPARLTERRILIVDDNRDGAESLAMLLRILGKDVTTVYDGEQAFRAAQARGPDIILLDITMPKMNGYETCRRIRQEVWGREILMVAITGWGQDEDRRQAEESGFDGHLLKPVDAGDLSRLIATLSERKRG
jgi:PAS domain S-box-containing protein